MSASLNYIYELEDLLAEAGIGSKVMSKGNSTRPVPLWDSYLSHTFCKTVKAAGNEIARRFPKSIHVVTQAGVEPKVVLFVLVLSINLL